MANKNLTTNYLSRLSNARSALPLSSSEATERTTTVCRSGSGSGDEPIPGGGSDDNGDEPIPGGSDPVPGVDDEPIPGGGS